MPTLDVTPILNDPQIADTFTVIRRREAVSALGRAEPVEVTYHGVVGVVTANSPSDLDRRQDYDGYSRSISVVSKFKLRGQTAGGGKPDYVLWRGSRYLVKHVDLYPHFGPGFYQAEASSIEHNDPDIEADAPATGAAQFNTPEQSGILGALQCC